jgi:hypothetical protein
MKRWAPPLMRICVFLLLGAIVNVAVAWGCCMYGYRNSQANAALRHSPTHAELAWWRSVNPPQGVMEPVEIWPIQAVGFTQFRHRGSGPIITRPNGDRVQITSAASWNEAGLPVPSFRGVWFYIPDAASGGTQVETRGAKRVDSDLLKRLFPKRCSYLPYWPIWPGFPINTLFYAVILWGLFAAPFALRRRRRIKRGLCPACAYPVGASDVCTECGKPVAPKAVTA